MFSSTTMRCSALFVVTLVITPEVSMAFLIGGQPLETDSAPEVPTVTVPKEVTTIFQNGANSDNGTTDNTPEIPSDTNHLISADRQSSESPEINESSLNDSNSRLAIDDENSTLEFGSNFNITSDIPIIADLIPNEISVDPIANVTQNAPEILENVILPSVTALDEVEEPTESISDAAVSHAIQSSANHTLITAAPISINESLFSDQNLTSNDSMPLTDSVPSLEDPSNTTDAPLAVSQIISDLASPTESPALSGENSSLPGVSQVDNVDSLGELAEYTDMIPEISEDVTQAPVTVLKSLDKVSTAGDTDSPNRETAEEVAPTVVNKPVTNEPEVLGNPTIQPGDTDLPIGETLVEEAPMEINIPVTDEPPVVGFSTIQSIDIRETVEEVAPTVVNKPVTNEPEVLGNPTIQPGDTDLPIGGTLVEEAPTEINIPVTDESPVVGFSTIQSIDIRETVEEVAPTVVNKPVTNEPEVLGNLTIQPGDTDLPIGGTLVEEAPTEINIAVTDKPPVVGISTIQSIDVRPQQNVVTQAQDSGSITIDVKRVTGVVEDTGINGLITQGIAASETEETPSPIVNGILSFTDEPVVVTDLPDPGLVTELPEAIVAIENPANVFQTGSPEEISTVALVGAVENGVNDPDASIAESLESVTLPNLDITASDPSLLSEGSLTANEAPVNGESSPSIEEVVPGSITELPAESHFVSELPPISESSVIDSLGDNTAPEFNDETGALSATKNITEDAVNIEEMVGGSSNSTNDDSVATQIRNIVSGVADQVNEAVSEMENLVAESDIGVTAINDLIGKVGDSINETSIDSAIQDISQLDLGEAINDAISDVNDALEQINGESLINAGVTKGSIDLLASNLADGVQDIVDSIETATVQSVLENIAAGAASVTEGDGVAELVVDVKAVGNDVTAAENVTLDGDSAIGDAVDELAENLEGILGDGVSIGDLIPDDPIPTDGSETLAGEGDILEEIGSELAGADIASNAEVSDMGDVGSFVNDTVSDSSLGLGSAVSEIGDVIEAVADEGINGEIVEEAIPEGDAVEEASAILANGAENIVDAVESATAQSVMENMINGSNTVLRGSGVADLVEENIAAVEDVTALNLGEKTGNLTSDALGSIDGDVISSGGDPSNVLVAGSEVGEAVSDIGETAVEGGKLVDQGTAVNGDVVSGAEEIVPEVDGVISDVVDAGNEVAVAVSDIGETVVEGAKDVVDEGMAAAGDLASGTEEIVPNVDGAVYDVLDAGSEIVDAVSDIGETVVEEGGELVDQGTAAAGEVASGAEEIIPDVDGAASDILETGNEIGDAVSDIGETVVGGAEEVVDQGTEVIGDVASGAGEIVPEVDGVVSDVADAGNEVGGAVPDIGETVLEGAEEVVGQGTEVVGDVALGAEEIVPEVDGVVSDVSDAGNEVGGAVPDIGETVLEGAEEVVDQGTEVVGDVASGAEQIVPEVDGVVSDVVDAGSEVGDTVSDIGKNLTENTGGVVENVKEAAGDAVSEAGKIVEGAVDGAKAVIEGAIDAAGNVVQTIGDKVLKVEGAVQRGGSNGTDTTTEDEEKTPTFIDNTVVYTHRHGKYLPLFGGRTH